MCACLEFAAFISCLHTKDDILVYFSPVFLGFKFCRLQEEAFVTEKESSAYHGYFAVSAESAIIVQRSRQNTNAMMALSADKTTMLI